MTIIINISKLDELQDGVTLREYLQEMGVLPRMECRLRLGNPGGTVTGRLRYNRFYREVTLMYNNDTEYFINLGDSLFYD
ncbi:MAG: hypothetical protein ISS48_04935 [Candidatus Aenigmarchaeota archaeon]|nr:hypothetical protein [Candidatus Aenigmarchaeota archaeon]